MTRTFKRRLKRDYQLETRSLLYFIAVAEEKNICRASTRLHITQPALTRQIHALEEELGVSLFTRTSAGMGITPSGTALLQHARTIQAELENAKKNALRASNDQRMQMNIGVYGSAIFSVVPQILKLFSQAHPDVEFRLHNARKDQLIEFLRQGKILIAFDRYLPLEPDLAYEAVYSEDLFVALHKEHPLANRAVIDMNELTDEPRVGANFDESMASELSRFFGSKPKIVHRADDMLSTLSLVSCGFGITFAPPSVQSLQIPNVVFRPYKGGPRIPFDVQCMYRKNDQSPLLLAILGTVRAFRAIQTAGK